MPVKGSFFYVAHIRPADRAAVGYEHHYDIRRHSQMVVYPQDSPLIVKGKHSFKAALGAFEKQRYLLRFGYSFRYLSGKQ